MRGHNREVLIASLLNRGCYTIYLLPMHLVLLSRLSANDTNDGVGTIPHRLLDGLHTLSEGWLTYLRTYLPHVFECRDLKFRHAVWHGHPHASKP